MSEDFVSLPSWERGLKYSGFVLQELKILSLPSWERGLKYKGQCRPKQHIQSLPSWERGLKFVSQNQHRRTPESLPSWERGLKYQKKLPTVESDHVAPLVGAWIEIVDCLWFSGFWLCRSPRGSVD